jgi:hypothetical protein
LGERLKENVVCEKFEHHENLGQRETLIQGRRSFIEMQFNFQLENQLFCIKVEEV